MNYLEFDGDTPVTGIPMLDDAIKDGKFEYNGDAISMKLIYNRVMVVRTELHIDHIMLLWSAMHKIRYSDVDIFNYCMNNFNNLDFKIGKVKCYLVVDFDYVEIIFNSDKPSRFRTNLHIGMPFEEFVNKTKLVLKSLITENINHDIRYISCIIRDYESAMKCRTKSASFYPQ